MILSFLKGSGTDHRKRTVNTVLEQDDAWLENQHDYIQWLFPLTEPSKSMPRTPFLTPEDVLDIRMNQDAQDNLGRALKRMTAFYESTNHWLVHENHNHLRIARILKSTKLLISNKESQAFFNFITQRVKKAGNPISTKSIDCWSEVLN